MDPTPKPKIVEAKPSPVEQEMRRIDELVMELKTFEGTNVLDKKVIQAMDIVKKRFQLYKDKFLKLGILVTYHGSLQYNDPKNLDLDIAFISEKEETKNSNQNFTWLLADAFELEPKWPDTGTNNAHCDTNFSFSSIQESEEEVESFKHRQYNDENDFSDYTISYILTSRLLFPEQIGLLDKFKAKAKMLLRRSPILRQMVLSTLGDAINIRKARRLQKDS